MRTRIGNTRLRIGNVRLAVGSGSAAPAPTYASTFTTALSPLGGQQGASAVFTVTPGSGGFPGGLTVQPTVTGFSAPAAQTTTAGSTSPLTFNLTVTGAAGTNAIVNVAIAGMTTQTGAQQFAISAASSTLPPSTPVTTTPGQATRADVVFDQSAVAPGGTATGKVIPNGQWSAGGTMTLTPSSGPAVTISLPSSGGGAVTFSAVAPNAEGEVSYAVTNTAGLINCYPPPLTVMTAGPGTAATITGTLSRGDMATFQRDAVSGNPAGFSTSWARGWGEVWFNLSQSGPALFVRLYDCLSNGATSTVGTGTALTGVVQVHGQFAAGQVRVLLPAGPYRYYADVATDAAFTNPVRVAQRFGVGYVIGCVLRSYETGLGRDYAGAGNGRLAPFYVKTTTWLAYDRRYSDTSCGWFRQDGVSTDSYQYHGEVSSSGPQEIGRLIEAQLGVVCGITGVADTGGGTDAFFNRDGSFACGFADTVAASCGRKFRALWVSMSDWDGVDSNYPTESYALYQGIMQGAFAKVPAAYPACAIIRWCSGASGWFGGDGSRDAGRTRVNGIARAAEQGNPVVASGESTLWNDYYGNHATQIARLDYLRTGFRQFMAAEPAAMGGFGDGNRGPTLGSTGTVSGRVISIPFAIHGGSALTSVRAVWTDPTVSFGAAGASDIAALFGVYAGANGRSGTGPCIKVSGAAINAAAGTIDLTLAGSSGASFTDGTTGALPAQMTVTYGADFGGSAGRLPDGYGASLCDNVSEFGIPYGRLMRPALDITVS